jgi:hypothetical protein
VVVTDDDDAPPVVVGVVEESNETEEPKTPNDNEATDLPSSPSSCEENEKHGEVMTGNDNQKEVEKEEEPKVEEVVKPPPPTKIPFGSRWGNFGKRMQERAANRFKDEQVTATDNEKKAAPAAAAVVVPVPSAADYASMRASKISMTVTKETMDSKWGFGIGMAQEEEEEEKDDETATTTTTRTENNNHKNTVVKIKAMAGMGLLQHAPFQEGDILKTVNNQKCTDDEATIQQLVRYEGGVPITLEVETPMGNPNLVQAMVIKPTPEAMVGIGFFQTEPQPSDGQSQSILKINHLTPTGLLAHSVLNQGHWVLAINATPCSHMTAEEAADLIKTSGTMVTIVAMKPPSALDYSNAAAASGNRMQRWMRHAKRAGIAVGGGAMVGVGLIFIPTLPPPFGEVLIIGGVSALGTEFEAPKRFMKGARDSLEKAVGRDEEGAKEAATIPATESSSSLSIEEGDAPPNGEETTSTTAKTAAAVKGDASVEQTAAVEDSSTTTSTSDAATTGKPKPTMKDRFKNFGRKHVLPFLDSVVGDKQKESEQSNQESEETATTTDSATILAVEAETQEGEETGEAPPSAEEDDDKEVEQHLGEASSSTSISHEAPATSEQNEPTEAEALSAETPSEVEVESDQTSMLETDQAETATHNDNDTEMTNEQSPVVEQEQQESS